jgi:hypothetical protein
VGKLHRLCRTFCARGGSHSFIARQGSTGSQEADSMTSATSQASTSSASSIHCALRLSIHGSSRTQASVGISCGELSDLKQQQPPASIPWLLETLAKEMLASAELLSSGQQAPLPVLIKRRLPPSCSIDGVVSLPWQFRASEIIIDNGEQC